MIIRYFQGQIKIIQILLMRSLGTTILILWLLANIQCQNIFLQIVNSQVLSDQGNSIIYNNNRINQYYDDTTYMNNQNCRSGNLNIINNSYASFIEVKYQGLNPIAVQNIKVTSDPNQQPKSYLAQTNNTHFKIAFNCSKSPFTNNNYWNKVKVTIQNNISFSFLVDCDPGIRHKHFQYGYLTISIINAAITIGVAMHSYVWSIKISFRPLRYHLKWIPFLFFSTIGIIIGSILYFFATKHYMTVLVIIRYAGIAVSTIFVFICLNQIFYLARMFRKKVYNLIRVCEILSFIFTSIVTVIALLFQNWILYNFLAGFICIGCIKIFHFTTLKDAFISMTILIVAFTSVAITLHFLLPRSYNDYAAQLSSPFFFQVPDLVNNLFKKCSWLPVIDVILPGMTLAYLRIYDQNRNSKWGGVYTISGNIAFVSSTILWIGFEWIYPFTVPFSLITYSFLMIVVFLIAWRRNQWHTLVYGLFQQGYDTINTQVLRESRRSFSQHISKQAISQVLVTQDKIGGSSIISN